MVSGLLAWPGAGAASSSGTRRPLAALATLTPKLAFVVPPDPDASIVMRLSKPPEDRSPLSASRKCMRAPERLPEQATARLRPLVSSSDEIEHRFALLTTASIVSSRCPFVACATVYRKRAIDGFACAALATLGAMVVTTGSDNTTHTASGNATVICLP